MTSLKRPLEMDLILQKCASPPSLTHLNSANNMHKKRCTFNQNYNPYMATNRQQEQPSTSNSNNYNNINNLSNEQTNSDTSDSQNQLQNDHRVNHQEQQQQHQHYQQQQQNHHQQSEPRQHQHHQEQSHNPNGTPFKDSSTLNLPPMNDDLSNIIREELSQPPRNDAPVLSLRQTQIICERLLQLRERRLREEYDKILISKLTEQHDVFVKYTHDHIEEQYNSTKHQYSYLS